MDYRILTNKISYLFKSWLEKKASLVNHGGVAKSVYLEVDISAGYFLNLTIANLIALSGLILNNTAVIIGAMLISPLMGPILSTGFSFTTGNAIIGRKALRKIALSVAATLVVAAAATYLSPLKDVTSEILSRTKPNLYDLMIAFLAGGVGAVALCTKKNYITVVTGVAIATAVIPPLSVAGYGLGSLRLDIAVGGFFLFFTNFVAIIISTGIVFFVYGFRPGMMTQIDLGQLKKRFVYMALILIVISVPLIYTLHRSISEVRLRSGLDSALRNEFNVEKISHLSSFNYSVAKDGGISLNTDINTVRYFQESEVNEAERRITKALGRPVKLSVEQILVQSGGLKESQVKAAIQPAAQKSPEEAAQSAMASMHAVIGKATETIDRVVSPSSVAEFYIGRGADAAKVSALARIRRDGPLSADEGRMLGRVLSDALKLPVDLSVETVPFVAPLEYAKNTTAPTEEMKRALIPVRDAYAREHGITIRVVSYPGANENRARRSALADKRAREISDVLSKDFNIPGERIKRTVYRGYRQAPTVKVTVSMGD